MELKDKFEIQHILKKIENSFAIWFKQSKSFLLLEEPAYDVFHLYEKGIKQKDIIKICKKKYGDREENISQFVNEIVHYIHHYNNTGNQEVISKLSSLNGEVKNATFLPPVYYKFGTKVVSILYDDEYLKFAIHPLLAHLEVEGTEESFYILECFLHEEIAVLKMNGQLIEAFSVNEMHYYTGAVRQLLYSILCDRHFNDWLAMLHASGIVSNNSAILFSAASGSGKSTISAILKAKGYDYINDDFIATDKNGKVYPFPAAISIKEGSVKVLSEYYPELLNTETKETFIGKMVKYLPVDNITEDLLKGTEVKAFVFVNYSENGKFIFEKVSKKHALQYLLEETWVNPEPEYVTGFFNWIEQTEFYNLQYSDTEEALGVVQKIFNS